MNFHSAPGCSQDPAPDWAGLRGATGHPKSGFGDEFGNGGIQKELSGDLGTSVRALLGHPGQPQNPSTAPQLSLAHTGIPTGKNVIFWVVNGSEGSSAPL